MDKKLLLMLLQKSKEEPNFTPSEIEDAQWKRIKELLEEIHAQGHTPQQTIDGSIHFDKELRTRLALTAARKGLDFDEIVKFLSWQEFELLITHFGEEFGYTAKTGLTFSTPKRKYQIDVVLKNRPYIFLIDAKHHNLSGKRSMLREAVIAQITRCQAVKSFFHALEAKLEVRQWPNIILVPLLVTWRNEEMHFYERVPIVPIAQLQSFFREFYLFFEDIYRIEFEVS